MPVEQPDKLAYAAPVFGGFSHLSMVLFLKRAGLEMTPVSYKGGAAPLADVIAGHVPIYFATLSEVVPHARTRRHSPARGVERKARAAAAGRPHFRRGRISRVQGAHLERPDGARRRAQGNRRPDRERGCARGQGRKVCRAARRFRRRPARQYPRAVRRDDCRGHCDCGAKRSSSSPCERNDR